MALQIKYTVRQFVVDAQGPQVQVSANVLVTTYDDAGNVVKQQSADTPSFAFSALPANIQADLLALQADVLAALKTYYGSQAVALVAPASNGS